MTDRPPPAPARRRRVRAALLLSVLTALLAGTLTALAPGTAHAVAWNGRDYRCTADMIGGTAASYNSQNAGQIAANPARCGTEVASWTIGRRYVWKPGGVVNLSGRLGYRYTQFAEYYRNSETTPYQTVNEGTVILKMLAGPYCLTFTRSMLYEWAKASYGTPSWQQLGGVQINQKACWDGYEVWLPEGPLHRTYGTFTAVSGSLSPCANSSSGVNARAVQVTSTCGTTVTNPVNPEGDYNTNISYRVNQREDTRFGLRDGQNTLKYYTLTVDARGCFAISGIGDSTLRCR